MKYLILILMMSPPAHADQESARDRLSDCFDDVSWAMSEANNANRYGSRYASGYWFKVNMKRERCIKMRTAYESKYGKYTHSKH